MEPAISWFSFSTRTVSGAASRHHARRSAAALCANCVLVSMINYRSRDGGRTAPRRWRSRKFSRKFVSKIRFRSSFGRSGASGKSRATRCQNSSLLRRLATTKTSKKRFRKKSIFWGFGNQFFVIFPGFWRS